MSGLFGSLSMAARALDAQRFGLDVAGQNIANVNTPGYARREVGLASVPPTDNRSAGGGVEITGLRAQRDARLERRLQQERPLAQREVAIAQTLAVVESAIGQPGTSIDAAISGFFGSLGRLAGDPTSTVERAGTASQGSSLAASFRDMSGRLDRAARDADAGVRDGVAQVNALTGRISRLNAAIGSAAGGPGAALSLQDDLGEALKSLSELIDIGTIVRPTGAVDVSFGTGHPLVINDRSYALDVVSAPPSGFAGLASAGTVVTGEVTGGTIGGLVHARDALIPGYVDHLDTLAAGIVSQVNTVHQSGYGVSGTTGQPFFTPLASVAGAARAMTMSAGILADPRTIATGTTATPGDNGVARTLADLRDARGMAGGTATFSDTWGTLAYQVGSDSRTAQDEQETRGEIVRQVELMREQVSGVSLDEEAMMMMKFQRAYEANARFFQTIDSTLDVLMSLAR